jgi:NadR type nicotinamide-nucleotide adenylyltransferase
LEKTPIIKIAIVGAESTGKSTLVKELAKHYHSVYVDEYARDYFNQHNINDYTIDELSHIYLKQTENENVAIKNAGRFLFCDTALITGKIWSEEVFGKTTGFLKENLMNVHYDFYLVMSNDIPWEQDEQRKNPHNRNEIFEKNIDELKKLNADYAIVNGIDELRTKNAIVKINKKYGIN